MKEMNEPQEPRSVRARIYDREYVLSTDGDPKHLQALCAVLDERMHEMATATGAVDTLKVAVLAALSIADDVRRAKEETMRLDNAIGKRSIACVSMLDRLLPPSPR
jgi:cell division protein ZapA